MFCSNCGNFARIQIISVLSVAEVSFVGFLIVLRSATKASHYFNKRTMFCVPVGIFCYCNNMLSDQADQRCKTSRMEDCTA